MSKYNILIKITGSIAAYKSAYLISKLVQDGNEVRVVASDSALEFIGKATLEGLTAHPVYTDSFEHGKMMSHINLVKWADLTIVCPASANTINKLAKGVGDTLLTSLFLAHDWNKPYLIAPAMNTAMFEHPATQESLNKLENWGVTILPTAEGYLACGDYGSGKLLEPEKIYELVYEKLPVRAADKKIIITAGGTKESIDGIREITNISTGKTAAAIAQYFIKNNYHVTFLHAENSAVPAGNYESATFTDYESLDAQLKSCLANSNFNLVIHNAAVSDYSLKEVILDDKTYAVPIQNKLSSSSENMQLKFTRNDKLLNKLKDYSRDKDIKIAAFKFTNEEAEENRIKKVSKLFADSAADLVVHNDFNNRTEKNTQQYFTVFNSSAKLAAVKTVDDLSQKLEELVFSSTEKDKGAVT